jgi:hypothetical protein
MLDSNFVQVLNVVRLWRNITCSLGVLVKKFAFPRFNGAIAPILKVITL